MLWSPRDEKEVSPQCSCKLCCSLWQRNAMKLRLECNPKTSSQQRKFFLLFNKMLKHSAPAHGARVLTNPGYHKGALISVILHMSPRSYILLLIKKLQLICFGGGSIKPGCA